MFKTPSKGCFFHSEGIDHTLVEQKVFILQFQITI